MCGRYTLRTRLNQLGTLFSFEPPNELPARYNIAPTQSVAAVRNTPDGGGKKLAFLRWGLIPSWATDKAIGNRLINARAETLAEKPSFKHALKRRRCLILADGFYEWKTSGKNKQPYFIQMKDGRPFAFAGLWERWSKSETAIESCTIITTSPNSLLAELHNRMPVILSEQAAHLWLDPEIEQPEPLTSLLVPYSEDEMIAYPVSTLVNSPKHDSSDCIEPVDSTED